MLLARHMVAWPQALPIVQPDTLLRWRRELFRRSWRPHAFAPVAAATGIIPCKPAIASRCLNATCERCPDGVRRECLDHMFAPSKTHPKRVLRECIA